MSSEYLSQEEVDALLKGVDPDGDEPPVEVAVGGVRPYNLATQERIVRGRMPTLEIINDRFMRLLRRGMFHFIRRSPELSSGTPRMIKYSEFTRNLVVPSNLNIVQMKPLRGSTLFVIEPSLVFMVIDNLFGGDGRFHTRGEGRDFTATEQRIIEKLLAVVLESYGKAWQTVHAVNFQLQRSEMHAQFANIATPTEVVVVTSVKVEIGSSGGSLHICIPYSTLEPIRDILYSSVQGDGFEPDRRWLRMLKQQVQLAEVEVVAPLSKLSVPIQHVLNMRVGDVLSLDLPQTIVAQVEGVPLFECHYGTANGQYAIKVDKFLAVSQKDNALGEEHV